jgi:hypothetical protein
MSDNIEQGRHVKIFFYDGEVKYDKVVLTIPDFRRLISGDITERQRVTRIKELLMLKI